MCTQAGEEQRERENPTRALCCQHGAYCGARSHELWDHDQNRNQEPDVQSAEPPRPQPPLTSHFWKCSVVANLDPFGDDLILWESSMLFQQSLANERSETFYVTRNRKGIILKNKAAVLVSLSPASGRLCANRQLGAWSLLRILYLSLSPPPLAHDLPLSVSQN